MCGPDMFQDELDRELWAMYFQPEPVFDEDVPIPSGSGTSQGIDKMWQKARAMSDEELATVWEALKDYSPRDYFDRENGIGMDDWCYCVSAVMEERGVPHFPNGIWEGHVRYQVVCMSCGQVFQPDVRSSLWWKAKKRAEEGYIDALCVSGIECGCEEPPVDPDAPYRVGGYNDLGEKFDYPFESLVPAARVYLLLEREGMSTVFFITKRTLGSRTRSRLEERLEQLARGW